jgi:hypothetical protein
MPHSGQAELCVRNGDFDIADGRGCPLSQQARPTARRSIWRKTPTMFDIIAAELEPNPSPKT